MTTIKSVYSKLAEYTRTLEISDHAGGKNLVVHAGPTKLGVTVPTAELAAALGLVTREDFDKLPVTPEQYNHAINELHAKVSRAHCGKDYWKKKAADMEAERDDLHAELEGTKAIIERARELLPVTLRAALDPKPAFVLPTEVPATIGAVHEDGDHQELHLWTDGRDLIWSPEGAGDTGYTPDQVMEYFTDHRLLGADQ